MSDRFRPLAHYLQKAAGLTSSRFLQMYDYPVLLWSQGEDWIDTNDFQFETYSDEVVGKEPENLSPGSESQIAQTLVIEVRKKTSPAPSNMICVGRAANNDIVFFNNTVSKLHCYFLEGAGGGSYEIVDANSTNGTLVKSKRLVAYENQALGNRDHIQFGPSIDVVYLTPEGFYDLLQRLQRTGIV
jgi:pSer/pThr/pTyr-binding forkhead associated (FHA) protein